MKWNFSLNTLLPVFSHLLGKKYTSNLLPAFLYGATAEIKS